MPKTKFTKENLDSYLKELGKEYRKLNGTKMPAEVILIGGAALLVGYAFRESTYDIDALIQASSSMKDAINKVSDKLDLSNGWFNDDFKHTASYSSKIIQYSKYYRTFSNVLRVRVISGEYLIATKLMAARRYKKDISDIIGIIIEQRDEGKEITLDDIKKAVTDLYGDYNVLSDYAKRFIEKVYCTEDLLALFESTLKEEEENKEYLINFESDYPGVLGEDNLDNILDAIQRKVQG